MLIFAAAVALRVQLAPWIEKRFGRKPPITMTPPYVAVFLCAMVGGGLILTVISGSQFTVVTYALFGLVGSLSELVAIAAVGSRVLSDTKSDA